MPPYSLLVAKETHKLFQQTCRVYYANKTGPAIQPLPNCKIQYFAFDVSQKCKVLTITKTHIIIKSITPKPKKHTWAICFFL